MFNSFVTLPLIVVLIASTILAQSIDIALPKAGTNVTAGSDITVKLDKPMSLTGSEEVAVVIAVFPCTSECPGANNVLGDVLYKGPYNPKMHSADDWSPYQNFSVHIPSQYDGPVQLGVAHFFLLGAGLSAELQTTNVTINVV